MNKKNLNGGQTMSKQIDRLIKEGKQESLNNLRRVGWIINISKYQSKKYGVK